MDARWRFLSNNGNSELNTSSDRSHRQLQALFKRNAESLRIRTPVIEAFILA